MFVCPVVLSSHYQTTLFVVAPDFERDNKNDTKEDKFGLNPSSGVFKAPGDGVYFVTFSAIIQTNKLDLTSYAQVRIC